MNRDLMKKEAVKRMHKLDLIPTAIKEFEDENKLNFSLDGITFWLDDFKMKAVELFEKQYGGLVYHVIEDHHIIQGEPVDTISLLYVSSHEEEWEMERADLDEHTPICYVINDKEHLKEFGSIRIKPVFGGVARVA